ncbi:MAG: ATP-grasp domain-containing protein [Pseudohongiellaceae bacterium]
MISDKKNVFVFGADPFNMKKLKALQVARHCRFHELFSHREVKAGPEIPVRMLYEKGLDRLRSFTGSVDAIVGYWDFPVSTMLPLLRQPFALPSPNYEAVLKCEHKYWSRLEQSKAVPDYVPDYCLLDPFSDDYAARISVDYPFWIKPVKSASSYLGFKVRNRAELDKAIASIRANIFRFANPFNYLLQFADLPPEVAGADGNHCIVESIISSGRQCTLEGYVHNHQVNVYGVVDSIREGKHRSSFARYQYPSNIPRRIQGQMIAVTAAFMKHIGFNDGPFNIEFYWEPRSGRLWLLEINTRISKSHCPLFEKVDGASNQQVMLQLALGEEPDFPHRQGEHRLAAKFMWRVYRDAVVESVPDHEVLRELEQRFPGAEVQFHLEPGMRLSDLPDQDSYSYEIGVIFLGGTSQRELLKQYRDLKQSLAIRLQPLSDQSGQQQRAMVS